MEIKDLMIGDWMKHTYKHPKTGEIITHVFRVYQIRCEWDDEPHDVWCKEDGNVCKVCAINPIPLTAKVLEDNGFERINGDWVYYEYKTDTPYIEMYWNGGAWKCNAVQKENECNISIKWVHELQHILRLFAFDKDIVL